MQDDDGLTRHGGMGVHRSRSDSLESNSTIRLGTDHASETSPLGIRRDEGEDGRRTIGRGRNGHRPDLGRMASTTEPDSHRHSSRPSGAGPLTSRRLVSTNSVSLDGPSSQGRRSLSARPSSSIRPPLSSSHSHMERPSGSRIRNLGKKRAGSSVYQASEDEDDRDDRFDRSRLRSRFTDSDQELAELDVDEADSAINTDVKEELEDLDLDAEYTLKDRQDAINEEHPFGLPIWKAALYKKSRSIQRSAESALHQGPSEEAQSHLYPGNIFWSVCFGCPLAIICFLVSMLLFVTPWGGRKYARVYRGLAGYLAWPFGKYVEGLRDPKTYAAYRQNRDARVPKDHDDDSHFGDSDIHEHHENGKGQTTDEETDPSVRGECQPLNGRSHQQSYGTAASLHDLMPLRHRKRRFRLRALGRMGYWFFLYICVGPLMTLVCGLCWLFVFTIPMAKLIWLLLSYLSRDPLSLRFKQGSDPLETLRSYDVNSDDDDSTESPNNQDRTIASAFKFTPEPGHDRSTFAVRGPAGTGTVLLCIYKAVGFQYYKYTVDGINIIFINLMAIVFYVILDNFVIGPMTDFGRDSSRISFPPLLWLAGRPCIFVLALASVIPLSYLIGMAVASISAQSSIGLGAVINASFGSIIEIILYAIALSEGKANLVEGSLVGSILAGVLLMPGVSMVSGAIRRKEQRFNARSAGVTSTMLIMAIIGTLTPTLFYQIYGTFRLTCRDCDGVPDDHHFSCHRCAYEQIDPVEDPFYQGTVKKLMYVCAGVLVLSYLIGLWFSLRTHASHIWHDPKPSTGMEASFSRDQSLPAGRHPSFRSASGPKKDSVIRNQGESAMTTPSAALSPEDPFVPSRDEMPALLERMTPDHFMRESSTARSSRPPSTKRPRRHDHGSLLTSHANQEELGGGHDAPNWSRIKSATVLLVCTALYSTIAEILVDTVDVVLKGSEIDEKFLGLTLFALVPNTTELANAVAFAMNGNIALSLEIGSAYALQVCLLQIPVMVTFSAFFDAGGPHDIGRDVFTLIWPRFDTISIILSVFLLTYVYIEGRSNYFRGSILLLSYTVLMAGFYFAPLGRGDIVQDDRPSHV